MNRFLPAVAAALATLLAFAGVGQAQNKPKAYIGALSCNVSGAGGTPASCRATMRSSSAVKAAAPRAASNGLAGRAACTRRTSAWSAAASSASRAMVSRLASGEAATGFLASGLMNDDCSCCYTPFQSLGLL